MTKTILITGSTDGIGRVAAQKLVELGHHVIIHGRNATKLADVRRDLSALGVISSYQADLSRPSEVTALAQDILRDVPKLDVLINNAGVFKAPNVVTDDGLDVRFMVNTLAPLVLTQRLRPVLGVRARVLDLSSAAQRPVNLSALRGEVQLSDMEAYAQSKLALTMWSRHMAISHPQGPTFIAVNPGSLLATNMVKNAFGMDGNDINIGGDILVRLALEPGIEAHSGAYYDNDAGDFGFPHEDANDAAKVRAVVDTLEAVVAKIQ